MLSNNVWNVSLIYFALLAAAELDPSNENVRQNIEVKIFFFLLYFHLEHDYGKLMYLFFLCFALCPINLGHKKETV